MHSTRRVAEDHQRKGGRVSCIMPVDYASDVRQLSRENTPWKFQGLNTRPAGKPLGCIQSDKYNDRRGLITHLDRAGSRMAFQFEHISTATNSPQHYIVSNKEMGRSAVVQ